MPRLLDFLRAPDFNFDPAEGAKLYVFENVTTTPVTTYSDRDLTIANTHPVVADQAGAFGPIYVSSGTYRVRITTADDVDIPGSPWDDVVVLAGVTSGGGLTFPDKAAAEATSVDGAVLDLHILRYAAPRPGGGGIYSRVASEPGHPGKLQTADGAWWELTEERPSVLCFGAVGDGQADDAQAIQDAVTWATAVKGGVVTVPAGQTFGILSPITISALADGVRLIGERAAGENLTTGATIKKLSGFVGDAAIIIGDHTGAENTQNVEVSGIEVDGNGQQGDGIQVWNCGGPTLRDNFVRRHLGWGIRVDGCFFPRLEYNAVKECGSHATDGGGFFMSNASRENTQGVAIGNYANSCANAALKFMGKRTKLFTASQVGTFNEGETITGSSSGETAVVVKQNFSLLVVKTVSGQFTGGETITGAGSGATAVLQASPQNENAQQNSWLWTGREMADDLGNYDTVNQMPQVALIEGANACTFVNVDFAAAPPALITSGAALRCVVVGEANELPNTINNLAFYGCLFQMPSAAAYNYAIEVVGGLEKMAITDPEMVSPSLLELSAVTEGEVAIRAKGLQANDVNDPNRLVSNALGGHVGQRWGSAGDRFDVAARVPGQTATLGAVTTGTSPPEPDKRVDLIPDEERLALRGVFMQHEPNSAGNIEATPRLTGDVFYWGGAGSFTTITLTGTGAGLYVCTSPTTAEKLH